MPELKFGETLDPVALYAAVVSTAVFLWEVFKWWRGEAAFRVSASPNMIGIGLSGATPTMILVEVNNTGKATTTITSVELKAYKTPLHRYFSKPIKCARVNSATANTVPFELKPGGRFLATGEQNSLVVGWSQHYTLYAGVYHTLSNRPLLARIKPIVEAHTD